MQLMYSLQCHTFAFHAEGHPFFKNIKGKNNEKIVFVFIGRKPFIPAFGGLGFRIRPYISRQMGITGDGSRRDGHLEPDAYRHVVRRRFCRLFYNGARRLHARRLPVPNPGRV